MGNTRSKPFELLTTALSALAWRRENGPIRMICDTRAQRYYDALGLTFLWDGGVHPLLDAVPEDVNPMAFWAAGKLYALSAMPSPCVMIDTDFICWKPLAPLVDGAGRRSDPPRGHHAGYLPRAGRLPADVRL